MAIKGIEEEYARELQQFDFATGNCLECQQAMYNWKQVAYTSYERIKTLRQQKLEKLLVQQELAICSDNSHYFGTFKSDDERIKLGIFPKGQMRLYYSSDYGWHGSEYTESRVHEIALKLLCPAHFPEDPNKVLPSEYKDERISLYSEVLEKDGRLITLINKIDVTDLPVERHFAEAIYRHFGFLPLPTLPR